VVNIVVSFLSSIIDLVHPTVSGLGVTVNDQAWVLFDRAMDETTLSAGCFFLTGPDFDTWIGPGMDVANDVLSAGSGSEDVLESPGFEGIVQGSYSFERVSLTDPPTTVTGVYDTVGSGHLYRTKVLFSPTNRLQGDTEYTVHLSGDDDGSDAGHMGVSAITVFDTVGSGYNIGSNDVQFTGGYIGSYDDRFEVQIVTSGYVGTSRFQYTRTSEPGNVFGPFRTKQGGVLLADCVTVEFPDDGFYHYGDRWAALVQPREIFEGNVIYPFKTGSGSIVELPATTSTTVLGDIPTPETATAGSTEASFGVSATSPVDNATNLQIPAGPYTLQATLNSAINPATVTSGVSASVTIQDVEGEGYPTELDADPSASGSVLSIVVPSGSLPNNKLVTATIAATVAGTNGVTLGDAYSWSFTTTYNPMYTTLRRIRLSIGNFIQDVPNDTINFAIYMASLMADELTWNTDDADSDYYEFVRQQWAHCKAEEILLMNTIGGSGSLKSKQLGDLRVEYNTSGDSTPALDRALQCQQKWEGALMAGGRQVQKPSMVVKGALDPDRPPVGRGWVHQRGMSAAQTPAANRKTLYTTQRRYYNRYAKGWWSK
jgi:hypothetical protein